MFSATGFIQQYLRKHLEDWVVDIPYESVHVGLLDGDLQLSNLQLRKQSWNVVPGISVSLELGKIGRFNIQVPWSKLHTGLVNCVADSLTLIFKLNIIDHESDDGPESSLSQEFKMVRASIIVCFDISSPFSLKTIPCVKYQSTGTIGQRRIASAR